jgi:RNA polymerase sigma-70 factor (ECF subfamily)
MSDTVRQIFTPAFGVSTADSADADERVARVYTAEIERLAGFGRLMMGGDASAGEDLAHEVFVDLLGRERQDSGYLRDPAWPWLRTALVHRALDRKRQALRELKRMIRVYDRGEQPWSDGTIDLARAVNTLPPRMRACVVLHYAQDMSQEQVAETLGCGIRTVETHLHRARQRLATSLGVDLDDASTPRSQERHDHPR